MFNGIANQQLKTMIKNFGIEVEREHLPMFSVYDGCDDFVIAMWTTGTGKCLNVWFDLEDIEIHMVSIVDDWGGVQVFPINTSPAALVQFIKPKLEDIGLLRNEQHQSNYS
jgi:hypothetical protein